MTRHDAFIGHERQRHDLIGCSDEFWTRIPMRPFTLELKFGSVEFMCCEPYLWL